mmetsp:Transcript_141604/g.394743  ORF Transcript_141604/g.394743 Transcript_141604/m.394743 type:complete len:431 (-) Transcript_141604:765-2057(-)
MASSLAFSSDIRSSFMGTGLKSMRLTVSFFSCFRFFCFCTTSTSSAVPFELSLRSASVAFSSLAVWASSSGLAASSSSVALPASVPLSCVVFALVALALGFSFVTFTQYSSSTVANGLFTSRMPLISSGTETEILGDPVMLYSFHLPLSTSVMPVTVYSLTKTPSSKTRMAKSSSRLNVSFFLPPSGVPNGYRVVTFFSHSPFRETTWTAYSWFVMSVKNIFLTRKELLELAATRAAPSAAASSPLRCCPSGSFFWACASKNSLSSSWTLGTRQPPPTSSTCWMSGIVALAILSALSMGSVRRANMSLHISSKSSRLMVVWKSVSSYRDSTMKGATLLELRMAFVFCACESNFRRARGFPTMPSASLGFFSWNFLSMESAIFRSMRCPPMPKSIAEPSTVTTGAVLPATMPAERLSKRTIDTSAFREPRL